MAVTAPSAGFAVVVLVAVLGLGLAGLASAVRPCELARVAWVVTGLTFGLAARGSAMRVTVALGG
jgi:hypothetical protein